MTTSVFIMSFLGLRVIWLTTCAYSGLFFGKIRNLSLIQRNILAVWIIRADQGLAWPLDSLVAEDEPLSSFFTFESFFFCIFSSFASFFAFFYFTSFFFHIFFSFASFFDIPEGPR